MVIVEISYFWGTKGFDCIFENLVKTVSIKVPFFFRISLLYPCAKGDACDKWLIIPQNCGSSLRGLPRQKYGYAIPH